MKKLLLAICLLLNIHVNAVCFPAPQFYYNHTEAVLWWGGIDGGYTGETRRTTDLDFYVPQVSIKRNSYVTIWSLYDGTGDVPLADVWFNNGKLGVNLATGEVYGNPAWITPKDVFGWSTGLIGQGYLYNGKKYVSPTAMVGGYLLKDIDIYQWDAGFYHVWSFEFDFPIRNLFWGGGIYGNSPIFVDATIPETRYYYVIFALISAFALVKKHNFFNKV